MHEGKPHFKIYSSPASQWAGVPLLGVVEKQYPKQDYEVEDVDLSKLFPLRGGNFDPVYVKINRNGTIPSLTSSSLQEPLFESTDILEYLNTSSSTGLDLAPKDEATIRKMKQLMDLVHSDEVSTNIILLFARNPQEMKNKQSSPFKQFLEKRQNMLEKYGDQDPQNEFYKARREINGGLYHHYTHSDKHEEFFKQSNDAFRGFAAGMDKLNDLIVLPYAAGSEVTYADIHMVPWLSHALWGAGTEELQDFTKLEALLRKSSPEFKIGERTKEWWANMAKRESFKTVYPHLH